MTTPSAISLARHLHETRRELLAHCGTPCAAWYRLSEQERAVAVVEARLVLEALRRADDEQATLRRAKEAQAAVHAFLAAGKPRTPPPFPL
ncbi:hypothetical protein QR97_01895 [Streptomyces sp. PBH53]|uniref:hypothetical protein n=1 Tax=Streptomyces sp. PBH53 TaxID=1577075 RepID=UPI0006564555|nr:hypothetical protein [Streptomyces sp. PBH53]AKN68720.1 hypothetical protein QR97_01895 [Streptomyces sp. PBH53]